MVSRFHLAIPAGDLDKAIKFYCDVLGCDRGNAEFKYPDAWADINFWGNELTLHATDPNKKNNAFANLPTQFRTGTGKSGQGS